MSEDRLSPPLRQSSARWHLAFAASAILVVRAIPAAAQALTPGATTNYDGVAAGNGANTNGYGNIAVGVAASAGDANGSFNNVALGDHTVATGRAHSRLFAPAAHRPPHFFRCQRHIDVEHAILIEGVEHGVDDDRSRAAATGFA